jgi:hypothetical protein
MLVYFPTCRVALPLTLLRSCLIDRPRLPALSSLSFVSFTKRFARGNFY